MMQGQSKHKTADRQLELVQAALHLAASKSPLEVTTAELAQAIGITQGGVFKHFESKAAIWAAALDWAHDALMAELEQAAQAAPEGQALRALRAVFLAHVQFVERYPGVPRLVFQELQHAQLTPLKLQAQHLLADYRSLLMRLLERAQASGQVHAKLNLQHAALLFIGAIQGLIMQSMINGQMRGLRASAQGIFNIYQASLSGVASDSEAS